MKDKLLSYKVGDREIWAGQVYKHTKRGSWYFITGIYKHSETGELLVGYRVSNGKELFVRPLEMFMDNGGPDGAYRFECVRS